MKLVANQVHMQVLLADKVHKQYIITKCFTQPSLHKYQ